MADRETMSQRQLGVHASTAVHATEVGMHLPDEIGDPRVAQCPLRWRATALRMKPRLRHT